MKITLTKYQVWNRKDVMLPNVSIKSLSIREKSVDSIPISIQITLKKFQLCKRK